MAIQSVTLKFNAKRTDNSPVFISDLTATAATRALAEANIAQQVADKAAAAQGNADELAVLQGMF